MGTQVSNTRVDETDVSLRLPRDPRPVIDPPVDRRRELLAEASHDLAAARQRYETDHSVTNCVVMTQAEEDLADAPPSRCFLPGLPHTPRYIPFGTWHRGEKMRRQARSVEASRLSW